MGWLNGARFLTHYGLHFGAPGALAWLLFRERWKTAWGLMVATMVVDADHLLADPVFEPDRMSVGFHPLHSYPAIALYALMLLVPCTRVRVVAVGLLFQMLPDAQDSLWVGLLRPV
ncbi:MAG: DUF6122 family protein [Nannocystales bacterium]